ncbi:MAG TPA: cation diffusion facilitator family transporter [Actinomycetes bacterium]|nr:cation diffusion facilitator family transporter [Actinomycetes bacterium]
MGLSHGHSHGMPASAGMVHRRRLVTVLAMTSVVMVVQVIGGLVTDSLALLADAGHMLTDVAGILLALIAVSFAARPATPERTFGYYRVEILAAVVNAVLLIVVATFIFIQAWQRWSDPPKVDGGLMLVFALIGLVANIVGLFVLRRGAQESLNVRGAYLEVLGDTFGSAAVIVAAVLIAVTDWTRVDVIASVVVALLILPRTWSLLREAIDVLLEATPRGVDMDEVRRHILEVDGVLDAHDLHVWTITSGLPVLSVHVVVDDSTLNDQGGARVLDRLGQCLGEHFDVEHCTFQLEPIGHVDHEVHVHH